MNSLNALGNRQISSLQADLAKMENGESGPSVHGQSQSQARRMPSM
jgi:Golgi SNAP receptor complex protein 2